MAIPGLDPETEDYISYLESGRNFALGFSLLCLLLLGIFLVANHFFR